MPSNCVVRPSFDVGTRAALVLCTAPTRNDNPEPGAHDPEGSGSVFDNTVLVWVPEIANGGPGNRNSVPYILAGGCGGHSNTGRFLTYDKRSHTDLFIPVGHALGFSSVNDFGHAGIAKGPLAGLLA